MSITSTKKYKMRLSFQVLEHLGFNLYSNIPAVLSEVVANAWDADADNVNITIEDDKIVIHDDGNGMSLSDINDKYLYIGYKKRNESSVSPTYKRPVMGRKGIGKLSLFSIAKNIEIYTVKEVNKTIEKNAFVLNRDDIRNSLENTPSTSGEYNPQELDSSLVDIKKGTKLIITHFDKNVNKTEHYLRRRLAKRFSVIDKNFQVSINNKPITIEDRDFLKKVQFLWLIGNQKDIYSNSFKNILEINHLNGSVKSLDPDEYSDFEISGWIGTVEMPSDLGDADDPKISNNKISLITRGKLSQEDILKSLSESGVFGSYLIGEITADALDASESKDIATSSRQSIREDDIRYQSLLAHLQPLIKDIKRVWTDMRKNNKREKAIEILKIENPRVLQWFDTLKGDDQNKAKDLFSTIESFHFDLEDQNKKRELYKQGIVAFEKLSLQRRLSELDKLQSPSDIELTSLFTSINDLEANNYYEIAEERVKIIEVFAQKLDTNALEKHLQKYLFDNLWLLNPSWERATIGTEYMEQQIGKAFKNVDAKLTKEEGKGRFDIRYRTSGSKHIIVELKRNDPTYYIDVHNLSKQANKYKNALEKCLFTTDEKNPFIEVIIILGKKLNDDPEYVTNILKAGNVRVIYYDTLVKESLESYSIYLERNKKIGKIREIIDNI